MRVSCVTGADRGIGLELVKGLLGQGYRVFAGRYLTDYSGLEELRSIHGNKLALLDLDVSEEESVERAVEAMKASAGRLDLLVNNAAILGDIVNGIGDELDFAQIEEVFRVNAVGPLRMSNALYPLLLAGEEKLIVNISSEAGSIGDCYRESWFGYCMSKSALNMQSALIHNRLRKCGGQVLVIHPGWVQTWMQGKLDAQAAITPEQSATAICQRMAERAMFLGDAPAYIDYKGARLPW